MNLRARVLATLDWPPIRIPTAWLNRRPCQCPKCKRKRKTIQVRRLAFRSEER